MIINLKTTKTLGVNVPLPLLGSGGELIEWLCPLGPKQTSRKTQSMSLLGIKRTWAGALQMSAFDPKRTSVGA